MEKYKIRIIGKLNLILWFPYKNRKLRKGLNLFARSKYIFVYLHFVINILKFKRNVLYNIVFKILSITIDIRIQIREIGFYKCLISFIVYYIKL